MRLAILLLVTGLLAWGVLQIVGDDGPATSGDLGVPPGPGAEVEGAGSPRPAGPTTGVLEVTVLSKSGHVPMGAEAGYRDALEDRWHRADERGRVLFTDAPLGKLEILGRAPGFTPASQRRFVNPGLRVSVILVLEKDDPAGPPKADR